MESKSSVNSLDTYSLKFDKCRNIYPIALIKPCERFKYDVQEQLKRVVHDINDNEVTIDCAVLDNPKRSDVKCAKSASAKFGCEYCENCAVFCINHEKKSLLMIKKKYEMQEKKILNEIEDMQHRQENDDIASNYVEHLRETLDTIKKEKEAEIKKNSRKQLTWPASTMGGKLRTVDSIREICDEIERNPQIAKTDPDYCKGIKGKSILLDQPFFNIVTDCPCEYMHLVCLGTVKRMVELNFKVGENRPRNTKRKLTCPKLFNEKIKSVQVFRESSRRCRNLDFGVMKASEFRNILLFFFIIILECIEEEFEDDRRVWLHLVFMIRSCVLPNNEFQKIDKSLIESACKNFYTLYEKLYGQINCTYSIHVSSHLLLVRGNRPLTFRSAFKFESFFSEMRHLFHPGSVSSIKQVLQNSYMKRILEFHSCEKKLFFSPQKNNPTNPGKENNSLIYTYEDDTLSIYSITEIIDDNNFNCNMQGKFKAHFSLTPEYNWSDVGVFRVGPTSEEC